METSTDTAARRIKKRKLALTGLVLVFSLIGLGYLGYWAMVGRFYVTTDDAYVGGNLVTLTARVPGTVVSIAADDTDLVSAGEPVVSLDPTMARWHLHTAISALALTVRNARAMRAHLSALEATSHAAYTLYEEARNNERRRRHLVALHAISRETWANSVAQTAALKARYLATQASAQALADEVGSGPLAQLPSVRQAATAVEVAYARLARCTVRAPVTGYVAKRHVQLGQHIQPGRPLMVIVPLHNLWVTANFKEDDLGSLRLGQKTQMVSEIYGSAVRFEGRVIGIGAGTGSAFALLPPSNASGNWISIVQRVPVRISLPMALLKHHPLRVGLTVTATVDIHDTHGRMLAAHPRSKPLYQTTVYEHTEHEAQALVHKILEQNGAFRGF
ncbi:MAG TPA: HlyD family efflux transporter periplasmic adaptor subunit [Acidiferrobacter sp.]|nr:HlyD family efflux transporter periplasmic adaptor subunit [Acidiferrobacter sp.]